MCPGLSAEAGRPATLTTEQALNYQMADETAETLIELLRIYDLGEAEIIEVELNWTEHVLRMLTHPVVTSILLAVAMFGLIAEVRTPGWGLGGTLALVALGLFFGSHLIVHLAEWQELALFAVGVTLLVVELVAIPGFGIVGVLGIGAMIASVVITQLGDFQLWSFEEIVSVIGRLAGSMIGAFVLSLIALRSLPKFAAFNRLGTPQRNQGRRWVHFLLAQDRRGVVGQGGGHGQLPATLRYSPVGGQAAHRDRRGRIHRGAAAHQSRRSSRQSSGGEGAMSFLGGEVLEWVYSLALLVLGFVLVLLEIFVIPGLNIFGIVGLLTAIAGIGYAYVNMGSLAAGVVAGLGLVGTAILVRLMLKVRAWNRLVLNDGMTRKAGYDSVKPGREALLGQTGQAVTTLRPAGRAQFGERVVDVVSEGGYIERGEQVEVLKVAGNRVVVQSVQSES